MTELSRITVLGIGVLGSQIAFHTAYQGFEVVAYDVDEFAVKQARGRLELLAQRYAQEVEDPGEGGRAQEALERIRLTDDLADAAAGADLVIESAPEQVDVKRDLFSRLDAVAPNHTVFVTNTSALPLGALVESTGRPERFLALHFVTMLRRHNIAEVMTTDRTDPEVHAAVVRFASAIGMVPILLRKEKQGYVLNSLAMPLLKAAGELLIDDVADPASVDDVWRIGTGAPYGPFEMLDIIGLTTAYHVASCGDTKQREFARLLKERYIDKGKLGVATGEGFYSYPDAGGR